jgi:hypothetical protein
VACWAQTQVSPAFLQHVDGVTILMGDMVRLGVFGFVCGNSRDGLRIYFQCLIQ